MIAHEFLEPFQLELSALKPGWVADAVRYRRSAQVRKPPLISEFLTAALENLLTKIGGNTQISKTPTR